MLYAVHFFGNMGSGAGKIMLDSCFSRAYPHPNESFLKISEYFYLFEHHFDLLGPEFSRRAKAQIVRALAAACRLVNFSERETITHVF